MCESYGALPVDGGVLDQPFAMTFLAAEMRAYAKAWTRYTADRAALPPRDTPLSIKAPVLQVSAWAADAIRLEMAAAVAARR